MLPFRSLPPFLRLTTVLGTLFILTALALLVRLQVTLLQGDMSDTEFHRTFAITMSLLPLSLAFVFPAHVYAARLRSGAGRAPLPGTWQLDARSIALLSVLPLCALVLALFVPFSPRGYVFPLWLSVGALLVNGASLVWARYRAANPAKPPRFR
jgi:hypothetical protein